MEAFDLAPALSEGLLLVGRVEDASARAGRLLELSRTHPGQGHTMDMTFWLPQTEAALAQMEAR